MLILSGHCKKNDVVHLILFHSEKTHSWRKSSSLKIYRSVYYLSFLKIKVGNPLRILPICNVQIVIFPLSNLEKYLFSESFLNLTLNLIALIIFVKYILLLFIVLLSQRC